MTPQLHQKTMPEVGMTGLSSHRDVVSDTWESEDEKKKKEN